MLIRHHWGFRFIPPEQRVFFLGENAGALLAGDPHYHHHYHEPPYWIRAVADHPVMPEMTKSNSVPPPREENGDKASPKKNGADKSKGNNYKNLVNMWAETSKSSVLTNLGNPSPKIVRTAEDPTKLAKEKEEVKLQKERYVLGKTMSLQSEDDKTFIDRSYTVPTIPASQLEALKSAADIRRAKTAKTEISYIGKTVKTRTSSSKTSSNAAATKSK